MHAGDKIRWSRERQWGVNLEMHQCSYQTRDSIKLLCRVVARIAPASLWRGMDGQSQKCIHSGSLVRSFKVIKVVKLVIVSHCWFKMVCRRVWWYEANLEGLQVRVSRESAQ